MLPQVHRTKVAYRRGVAQVVDLKNLSAEVRQVDHVVVCGLVASDVARVLEAHPAVAGLGQGTHHTSIQITSLHLLYVATFTLKLQVGVLKLSTVRIH